jgi:hypothetical protein
MEIERAMIVCLMDHQALANLPQFQPRLNFNSAGPG